MSLRKDLEAAVALKLFAKERGLTKSEQTVVKEVVGEPGSHQIITATILDLLDKDYANISPAAVNNGLCEEFQQAVIESAGLDGWFAECVTENYPDFADELPGHCWVRFRGRHYDAEAPQGVNNFLELPIFKRAMTGKHA